MAQLPTRREFDALVSEAASCTGCTSIQITDSDSRIIPLTARRALWSLLVEEMGLSLKQVQYLWPVPLEHEEIRTGLDGLRAERQSDPDTRHFVDILLRQLRSRLPSYPWAKGVNAFDVIHSR